MYHDEPPGFEIVELETKLQEARGEDNTYVARTAGVQAREKDVDRFLKRGWDPEDISELIRVPLCVVKARVARLEEERDDDKSQLERELAILEIFRTN